MSHLLFLSMLWCGQYMYLEQEATYQGLVSNENIMLQTNEKICILESSC